MVLCGGRRLIVSQIHQPIQITFRKEEADQTICGKFCTFIFPIYDSIFDGLLINLDGSSVLQYSDSITYPKPMR